VNASRSTPFRVAVAQLHCAPFDVAENLRRIDGLVHAAAVDGARLVVVPETATTGYFIADRLRDLAEPEDGPAAQALGKMAARYDVYLIAGFALRDGDRFYDAQLVHSPEGKLIATYRKVHLFASERAWYSAGNAPVVIDTPLGRIGLSICYDLIFPEFIRKLVDMGADIVVNSTNWITNDFQRNTWDWSGGSVEALARTRALENGVFLAMAVNIGPEAGFDSVGHSCLCAPSGKVLASAGSGQGVAAADVVLESDDLAKWRAIATYLPDRRPDVYK
jgi:predicted amidohydrolase